jgi:hypothetical protein
MILNMMYYAYLLALVVSVVLIFFTHRTKSNRIFWWAIVFPPLTLMYLIFINMDIWTVMHWLMGFLVMVFSIVTLLYRSVMILQYKFKRKDLDKRYELRLIRPALAIFVVLLAYNMVHWSMDSADAYARDLAVDIQKKCNNEKVCPAQLDGWEEIESWSTGAMLYGKYGSKYLIRYFAKGNSFSLQVKHDIDEKLSIFGGVDRPLKVRGGPYYDGRDISLDEIGKHTFKIPYLLEN